MFFVLDENKNYIYNCRINYLVINVAPRPIARYQIDIRLHNKLITLLHIVVWIE